jgi:predicted GNAT superfamily acetyltransferase
VNRGPGDLILTADDPEIAVEVPSDWTAIQGTSIALAQEWREATDTLLAHYIGADEGRYAVTDAARDGDRRYLLAKRVTPSLLAAYL